MRPSLNFPGFFKLLTGGFLGNNVHHVLGLVFVYYVTERLKRFREIGVKIVPIPDDLFQRIVTKYFSNTGEYVDAGACALGHSNWTENFGANVVNICSKSRKYRVNILRFEDDLKSLGYDSNTIFVSETLLFNIQRTLEVDDEYFALPACREPRRFADEVKISQISSPHEFTNDLIDAVLNNYFLNPKYLRKNDFITIDVRKYAPGLFPSLSPQLRHVYFKVNSVKIAGRRTGKPGYVVKGHSALIQDGSIQDYLPRNFKIAVCRGRDGSLGEEIGGALVDNCPRFLEKYLHQLGSCVLPFIASDDWMGLRPIFLVQGPPGSGKHLLITSLAKRLGLNFLHINCNEVQSPSPSQTEAKLRIAFTNAETCTPCLVKLSNIHILAKNSEGKTDERVTSSFSHQLTEFYSKKQPHPLIIIATSEALEIPPELDRHFLEKLQINSLNQAERTDLINWFLRLQRIDHSLDFSSISSMTSDFLMNDLKALTQNALRNRDKISEKSKEMSKLREKDFLKSYKSIESIFSEEIGALRIPEVHWEDIGGLAQLKHEIIRRIEIPLMKNSGIKTSGILLYGPPGTGKTLLAKAVATECKLNFLSIKGPELLNMYVGQSEKNVRDVFERAKSAAPCIIFFDELDALAPNRGRSGDSGGVMDRIVSQLLAEMDGLGSSTSTFVIGATNRPDLIDPALLRPGRFDKLLYVGIYADTESKLSVLKAITRKFCLETEEILGEIAALLPENITGADLQAVCADAWLNAARRIIRGHERSGGVGEKFEGDVEVLGEDFREAARGLVPSVSREELRRYEELHAELSSRRDGTRERGASLLGKI